MTRGPWPRCAPQAQEDVFGTDEAVAEKTGFLLGQDQDLSGFLGEALKHLCEDTGG